MFSKKTHDQFEKAHGEHFPQDAIYCIQLWHTQKEKEYVYTQNNHAQ